MSHESPVIVPFRPLVILNQKPEPVLHADLYKYSDTNTLDGLEVSQMIVNELEENKNFERQNVLERLQTNGFLVQPCTDKPLSSVESSVPEPTPEPLVSLTDVPFVEKDDGSDEDIDDEIDAVLDTRIKPISTAKGKKLGTVHIQLDQQVEKDLAKDIEGPVLPPAEMSDIALPKEPKYDAERANAELVINPEVVFVLCSSKTEPKPPGKEARETIPKDRVPEFVALGRISQWRQQLCNAYESPFQLDDVKWHNVDHYTIAAQYRKYSMQDAFHQYENALGIHKAKKHDGQKLTVDDEYESREKQEMFHALYAKFTQHPDLARVLDATKDAQLFYRVNTRKVVEFTELMWLRQLLRPYVQRTLKSLSEDLLPAPVRKRAQKEAAQYDLSEISIGQYAPQLPQTRPDVLRASSYYMNNRTQFIEKINKLFGKYSDDTNSGANSQFDLLSHQKVVRDYLDVFTPYRGLLVYHNLGTGKSCTSIAVTEGMKENKRIVILVPASLRTNYEYELQKCGDLLYRNNQYWEFVSTDGRPELIPILAKALTMNTRDVENNKGAWMVNVNKPPNFKNLSPEHQKAVRDQIHHMIHEKYTFLHYNANNLGTKVSQMKKISKNPFDHTTIVIDEAHNFVSNIVGNLRAKKKDSIYVKMYDMLMDATNLKVVMLSGTPIINYPQEIAVLFNILRGYIYTWTFKLKIKTGEKVNTDYIRKILDKKKCVVYDFIEYTRNTLVVTRNPYGFVNVNESAPARGARASHTRRHNATASIMKGGYGTHGVRLDKHGQISNDDFKKQIIAILKENEILVEGTPKVEKEKCLPDDEKTFQSTFLRESTNFADKKDTTSDLSHVQTLRRRILGLTSYFRSPNETLLPSFVLNENDSPMHEVRVPMSDYQFGEYAKVRKVELEKEKKAKTVKRMQKQQNQELFQMASSYRVFSRVLCNYSFPTPPGRPFPKYKAGKEETELDTEGASAKSAEKKEDVESDDNIKNEEEYDKQIESAMNYMRENRDKLLTMNALAQYSPKMLEILRRLKTDAHEGLHLLYSNFVTMEGIGIFQEVLHANGFQEFKIKKDKGQWVLDYEHDGRLCYALYTGNEDSEVREIVRNVYNGDWDNVPDTIALELRKRSENNLYGEIIKLFMITAAGAEGINLRNTRFVHIMEPYWHNVRLEQVIGRARRIKSHEDLPEELRTVQVFLYMSVMSETHKKDEKFKEIQVNDLSKMRENTPVTTDEYLYEISQMKQKINGQFLRVIKETAMDCHLYVQKHKKHEPLVCYGKGFEPGRTFVTYPKQKMDLDEDGKKK